MNGSGFQTLVAQLGETSEVLRKASVTALKRKFAFDEAVELIDQSFKAAPCCGQGGWIMIGGGNLQDGLARERCKVSGTTSSH
jgi:hypothetical protein